MGSDGFFSRYQPVLFPLLLFLLAFYLWTLPIQSSPLPFGEGDAAWHFGVGDYISSSDRTIDRLPPYIGYWYYLFNPVIGPHALEYPPSNHINYAIMQFIGSSRFSPVYIFKAVTSFLGIFAVYFLISRLYGNLAGFAAGLGLAFSSREIMTYLWGQQPTLISVVIVPAVLYAYYRYSTSLFSDKPQNIYLYMTALLVASQYMLHIQGVLVSAVIIAVFSAAMLVRHRSLPLKNISWVHLGICAAVLLAIVIPFRDIYLGPESDIGERGSFSRMFSWTIDPRLQEGAYPEPYFSFPFSYTLWLLPFILGGVAFLVFRRKEQDILMLSWLAGVYIILHLDVFIGASIVRVARMLTAEPALFFSLAAIGAAYLPSMLKTGVDKQIIRVGAVSVLCVLLVATIGVQSYALLKDSYSGNARVNQAEVDAADWIRSNVPEDDGVLNIGTSTYQKMRFIHIISQRYMHSKESAFSFSGITIPVTHVMLDYSEYAPFRSDPRAAAIISQIDAAESQLNGTKVYDRGDVRIYEVRNEG